VSLLSDDTSYICTGTELIVDGSLAGVEVLSCARTTLSYQLDFRNPPSSGFHFEIPTAFRSDGLEQPSGSDSLRSGCPTLRFTDDGCRTLMRAASGNRCALSRPARAVAASARQGRRICRCALLLAWRNLLRTRNLDVEFVCVGRTSRGLYLRPAPKRAEKMPPRDTIIN
jgi:hypothetical protein